MKRRIALFINGTRADLDDDGLVLYNYAFTDNDNPTAVKNSYSKQITLPGTPTNAKIFGYFERPDRVSLPMGGVTFNALYETPFEIKVDGDERLESGYLRLDSVLRDGRLVKGYKVSLFGGLGSFLYALSYDEDGNKKTLASLDYLGTANPVSELDFQIYAYQVSQAWARLAANPSSVSQRWDVINFAPAYNGYPEGEFSPDKGYGSKSDMGIPSQTGYSADSGGNCIVKFSGKRDEWAVKDLRAYLQRPVLSWRAFLQAVARPQNNGGYTFDYSDIPEAQYKNLWKTLPTIPSIGTFRKSSGTLYANRSSDVTTSQWVDTLNLQGLASFVGINVRSTIGTRIEWYGTWGGYGTPALIDSRCEHACVAFIQVVAYSGSTKIGGSKVICVGPSGTALGSKSFSIMRAETGFVPEWSTEEYEYQGVTLANAGNGARKVSVDQVFSLENTGCDSYRIYVKAFELEGYFEPTWADVSSATDLNSSVIKAWAGNEEVYVEECATPQAENTNDSHSYDAPATLRSGTSLGKAELLASQYTPAEYLVGWAKMNGFVFQFEPATKKVKLMRRNSFFQSSSGIDLSQRIDQSKDITITPLYAAARWYELSQSMVEGSFAKEYKDVYGLDYGIQKVNTGYAFDASVKKILDNLPFKSAAPILASGPYWNIAKLSGSFRPSPFVDAGNKYTLWDNNGTAKEFDLAALAANSTTFTYYNSDYNGYDVDGISRLEFRDKDGKGVDGTDVLCWYEGQKTMAYFQLTDDSTGMMLANDNKPCWKLTGATEAGISVPTFSRYKINASNYITDMLDFGRPKELNIPGAILSSNSITMYEKRWKRFLADRLNQETKMLKCRVDFSGLQVGPELLRKFYYFEGCYWVLNKIKNYSLTTYDPVECEFIQVQGKANYYNGELM